MEHCKIIELPKIQDPRGNLTFLQNPDHLPFEVQRVFWIYDVPGGEVRGGHAFKKQEEFIVAISGSFDVVIDDGEKKEVFHLNRSYKGLHIPAGMWRSMENFSTNSLALILVSTTFDENDYIRSYDEYLAYKPQLSDHNSSKKEGVVEKRFDLSVSTVEDCKVLELDKNHRDRGNITVVENHKQVPFDIKRVYYLYDVPGGEDRGGHAHKDLYQLIMAAGGSFDVTLDDGVNKKKITLNRPYQGLYVVPGIWRDIDNFSSGSTCLVLASQKYDEQDYMRDYQNFTAIKNLRK
ncbi:sugar 3,4-ketoisomerase [Flavobacterium ardleyense]|uniref:sugar 3,4-ketoisomerase n=1 Tax=Flavobacterium ardleyense TaxID=2038737 RepID=UPI00298CB83B|nr:FdtA/QdtA family cupin domain-containing protein [Flavobacterium ardleyense]